MRKTFYSLGLAAAVLATVAACTDARWSKLTALGTAARVTCHSGGKVVFDDFSTGKVSSAEGSDGFYFVAQSTGRLTEVSGQCVLDYGAMPLGNFQPVRQ